MKKFLLFLTLLISTIGLTHAEVKTISSNFAKKDLTVGKGELGWTASIEANSFETAAPSRGVQFGAEKGKFTMTSTNGISNFKQISLVISSNGTANANKITSIKVGGTEILSAEQGIAKANNQTVEYSYKGDTNISGTIEISFNDTNKSIYVKSITVTYDDAGTGSGEDLKDCGLAYDPESVSLVEGEALTQPKLAKPNTLTVTYSSDNEDVATVDAEGTISLAGGLGTAVITASTEGNDTYKAGSATFTITVKKAQIAYLVTDASTLKPGDVIVIAAYGTKDEDDGTVTTWNTAISTSNANADYRGETNVTFNSDHSEITSIPNDALLIELEQTQYNETDYWLFKTLNYTGDNGYLGNTALSSNNMKVVTVMDEKTKGLCCATIESNDDNTVEVLFNHGLKPSNSNKNGASYNKNYLQYNQTYTRFACYGAAQSNGQVYIYKVVDRPATVNTQVSDFTFAAKGEKENFNVIELENMFETSTTAENVAIYLDNVLVGTFPVTNGVVDAKFDYIPYLPNAEFTMRPVIKTDAKGNPTQLGPSEPLSFTWPNLDSSDTFGYGLYDEAIFCVNEDSQVAPWILYGQFTFIDLFKKPNLDYYVSVEAVKKDDRSFVYEDAQFAWGNGGFIVDIPNYFTSNKWDDSTSHPDITGCTVPKVTFIITPSYEFTYDTKYSSLVTSASAAPARLTVPGTTATQTIVSAKQELTSTLTNSSTVSGVEGVTVDANAPVEFFNLQGVRVDGALAPGIYIRRQGQAVSKVRIN